MRWCPSWSLITSLALAIGLLSMPVQLEAQSDASSDAEARQRFEEGRAAYEAGEFETAVRAFRRAYILSPRYVLLYNIGQSELRAGHDAEALEALEGFLRQAPEEDTRRSEVEERVRQLRAMGVTPGRTTVVEAGSASAPQRVTTSPTPSSDAAEPSASEPGPAVRTDASPPPDGGEDGGAGIAPWIVVGVGGALVVTGAALMGVGASDASRVTGAPDGSSWSELSGVADGANTMWGVGIALLGVGAAAAGAGVVWALLPSDSATDAHAHLRLAPGSIFVEGAF